MHAHSSRWGITFPPQPETVQGYCTVWERVTWHQVSTTHGTFTLELRCRSKETSTASANCAPAKEQRSHTATQTLRRRHRQVKKASEPCKRPVSRRRARELVRRHTKGICHIQETQCQGTLHISQSGPGCPCPFSSLVSAWFFALSLVRVFLAVFRAALLGLSPRFFPRFRVFPVFPPVFSVGSESGKFDGLDKFSPLWTELL